MERVSIISGKRPILIVSPHGYKNDDENTSVVAEAIANLLDCYGVVNRGWERADDVDVFNDKADCNNVTHCHEDVVKDEFLDPILRFRSRILKTHPRVHMFMIHGMSDRHREKVNDPNLDVVIGYGAGSPDSHTCDLWRKDLFITLLENNGMTVYEGKKGGQMSGWARNNMNQLFRKWYTDPAVQSMQIEITHELRADNDIAQLTAEYMAVAMKDMLGRTGYMGNTKHRQY